MSSKKNDEVFKAFKKEFLSLQNGKFITLKVDGKEQIYYSFLIPNANLTLIEGISKSELMDPIISLQKNVLLLILATILVSFLLTLIFGRKFSESIVRLLQVIDNIARGNYDKNTIKLISFIDINNELYLVKEALKKMQNEIKKREAKLKMLSETDPLTKIYNRRAILSMIKMELHRSNSFGTDFSLIMFDLYNFKNIHDSFGHQFGDEVLQKVTQIAIETLKKNDFIGRYGGEEFLILLPDTDAAGGEATAERIRNHIMSIKWENDICVTASFGVVYYSGSGKNLKALITSVDSLLYKAKENGRNCVESSDLV